MLDKKHPPAIITAPGTWRVRREDQDIGDILYLVHTPVQHGQHIINIQLLIINLINYVFCVVIVTDNSQGG